MKLYRGLKTSDFLLYSPKLRAGAKKTWLKILEKREASEFSFPAELAEEINRVETLTRLQRQHFTDDATIARRYAKSNKGALLEIDLPINEIVKSFTIEFQNFAMRKKKFEIVYVIDAALLEKNAKKWRLKITRF